MNDISLRWIPSFILEDPAYLNLSRPAKLMLAELCRQFRFLPNGLLVITMDFVKSIGEKAEQLWWLEEELANAGLAILHGYPDEFGPCEPTHFFMVAWRPCTTTRFDNLSFDSVEGGA